MTAPCVRIVTPDLDGPLNMALDEVLWHEAAAGTPFLRLYGWADRPCISIGYFQSASDVDSNPAWRGHQFVRRMTGGGAIVHDHDLTYSLALPAALAPSTESLYERLHQALAARLRELGIAASVGEPAARATPSASSPSSTARLCFDRPDRFALVVAGAKVLGSAQRRRAGAVLIHGSILLAASPLAPDLPGLRELVGRDVERDAIERVVTRAVERAASLTIDVAFAPPQFLEQATSLAQQRYRSEAWNRRR